MHRLWNIFTENWNSWLGHNYHNISITPPIRQVSEKEREIISKIALSTGLEKCIAEHNMILKCMKSPRPVIINPHIKIIIPWYDIYGKLERCSVCTYDAKFKAVIVSEVKANLKNYNLTFHTDYYCPNCLTAVDPSRYQDEGL